MPSFPEKRLKALIAKVLNVPIEAITQDASPDTIESWDSLRHMNLVLALENEFKVELDEDQVVEILTYKLIKIVLREHNVLFE
jgi:acyl carrier protein